MTVTALKHLAIVVALLAGGTSLALIGFLVAPQIIARQTSAPESAPTAQHSTPADQLVSQIGQAGTSGTVASPVANVQEAQPTPTPWPWCSVTALQLQQGSLTGGTGFSRSICAAKNRKR
ncbi:MAG: hypothetical protein WA728_06145 [Xanthobacteraceae bacterium]